MNNSPDLRDPSSQQGSNDVSIPMESEPEIKQSVNTSDGDSSDAEPASYFRNLSLKYFASEPLRMVDLHTYLMESCLEHNNPEDTILRGSISFSSVNDESKASDTYAARPKENMTMA
ncbi:unnamed protein product [Brassica rapa]|uniref:Uncharacterized protein n=1 Tax=Brassica campestris TaxID=3711 RepID=A0A3P5ZUE6_BRACM|nr:unnamed protein product [Brassica rapa]VDC75528.1 unnamed protein product [Brassica rapa]